GLGLAGLALYGASGRSGGNRGYGGYSHHGGYGGGHHGGSYGYHRRRRSPEEDSAALENLMEVIRAEDVSGCGRRLVCELAANNQQSLTVEELSILNLVGSSVKPGEGVLPRGASQEYKEARGLGEAGGDCDKVFPKCPLTGAQLMGAVMAYLP
ncbi:putative DM4/DM12 family-like protein 29, partial [Homarus americanus]